MAPQGGLQNLLKCLLSTSEINKINVKMYSDKNCFNKLCT